MSEFPKKLEDMLNSLQPQDGIERCLICGKAMIPAEDKYTWKFDCNCNPKNMRVAIG